MLAVRCIQKRGLLGVARRGVAAQSLQAAWCRGAHSTSTRSAAPMLVAGAAVGSAIVGTMFYRSAHTEAEGKEVSSADKFAHTKLYPPIEPNRTGHLKVSDLHTIYYEVYGNPNGKPVLFVHGGPGGGTNSTQARYFDPAAYRIILVDQRGCGRSTPFAELRENTTYDSVKDFEKLREHLGIDQWQVFGGSWGSTLSLAYAVSIAYPLASFRDDITLLMSISD